MADRNRPVKPYIVRADGTIADRSTQRDIGHVYRNDYGWTASLDTGERSPMHATREQAADSVWSVYRRRTQR